MRAIMGAGIAVLVAGGATAAMYKTDFGERRGDYIVSGVETLFSKTPTSVFFDGVPFGQKSFECRFSNPKAVEVSVYKGAKPRGYYSFNAADPDYALNIPQLREGKDLYKRCRDALEL